MTLICGIDPGLSGAVAIIDSTKKLITVVSTPRILSSNSRFGYSLAN